MKQERLTKLNKDTTSIPLNVPRVRSVEYDSGRTLDIDVADFKGNPLWPILIETARNNPLFANMAGIGEALVILGGYEVLPK